MTAELIRSSLLRPRCFLLPLTSHRLPVNGAPGVSSASGLMCLGPSFFVSAAFILSIFANSRCYFYYLSQNNPARDAFTTLIVEPNRIGLWCYEGVNGVDYNISNLTLDHKYEVARAIGTAVMAIGFFDWLFYLFAGCKPFPPIAFKFVGLLGVVNCILQSCVFLLGQSRACNQVEDGCQISTGGNCAIAAAVVWFVGGVLSCVAGKDVEEAEAAAEAEADARGEEGGEGGDD